MSNKSIKNGGHDRDRTCDPYHVKARTLTFKLLFHNFNFSFASVIAQSLPNHLSFCISACRCSELTVA